MTDKQPDEGFEEDDFDDPEKEKPEDAPLKEDEAEAGMDVILEQVGEFLVYVGNRFREDRCLRMAAGLSYTSLLAIVPLMAIAFSMLAAFPVFGDVQSAIQGAIFSNLLPDSADNIQEHLNTFIGNTTSLSAIGIVALALTAVLLLGTIEADMNAIFRVARTRALAPRLLVFWALLTLGPMLLGASLSMATYFYAATNWLGIDENGGVLAFFGTFLPTLMMIALLSVFYIIIPNRPVGLTAGIIGGLFAGISFTLLRKAFGWYIITFPTYQNIYGALSVVPIFLVWMYMSWLVVLIGAILTASVSEWRSAGGKPLPSGVASGMRLIIAVQILAILYGASREGRGAVHRNEIMRSTGGGGEAVDRILNLLRSNNFVERTSHNRWLLARSAETVTVYDLYAVLGLDFAQRSVPIGDGEWRKKLSMTISDLSEANRSALGISLADLFADDEPKEIRAAE